MSADGKLLLGMIELKNDVDDPEKISQYLQQTLAYTLTALAYSRMGVWRRAGGIVSLLVFPSRIFRLTVSKPQDVAAGLYSKLEVTEDAKMMEWVLFEYLQAFISDYKDLSRDASTLQGDNGRQGVVNPADWTSINLRNLTPLAHNPNLGFLFRTDARYIAQLQQQFGCEVEFRVPDPQMPIIIKCISAVLDSRYSERGQSLEILLAKLESRVMDDTNLKGGDLVKRPTYQYEYAGIKHPYLGRIFLNGEHPALVMRDMGPTLCDLLQGPQSTFREDWKNSKEMRDSFLTDVGFTALNLSEMFTICHNDIRPPNIAFSNNRFCLLDFDFSNTRIVNQPNSSFSPELSTAGLAWSVRELIMCYSVAQIAVNVFMLSSPEEFTLDEVSKARLIWLHPAARDPSLYEGAPKVQRWLRASSSDRAVARVDGAFERWVRSRGEPLRGFVALVRDTCTPPPPRAASPPRGPARPFPAEPAAYFAQVLRCMLA